MESLPERIVFIGGGYISFEFAHVAAAAGSKPTILHRSDTPLKQFEPDLVRTVVESSEADGIRVITEAPAQEISQNIDGFQVMTPAGPVQADLVISAPGRIPNIDALDLEKAGIEASKHGIHVNGYMQSPSNHRVYALGDSAAKRYPLSPVALREAEVTIENILNGNAMTMDYSVVPSVVFTHPPLTSVGLTEEEAAEAGMEVEVHTGDMSGWASSMRLGEKYGKYKVLIHKSTGMIAGAHIFAPRASESINIFALAMKYEISAEELKKTMFAYPTYVSEITSMLG
jgi:glutathione reductase (NADPH)